MLKLGLKIFDIWNHHIFWSSINSSRLVLGLIGRVHSLVIHNRTHYGVVNIDLCWILIFCINCVHVTQLVNTNTDLQLSGDGSINRIAHSLINQTVSGNVTGFIFCIKHTHNLGSHTPMVSDAQTYLLCTYIFMCISYIKWAGIRTWRPSTTPRGLYYKFKSRIKLKFQHQIINGVICN